MGEAKRRKKLDPSYGQGQRYRLKISEITGKWLVQTRVAVMGVVQWITATVYINKGDAEEALEQLKVLCDPYSIYELDRVFYGILEQLPTDDDEVLYLIADGELHDRQSRLVKDKMALLAEHGQLSDKLLTSRRYR